MCEANVLKRVFFWKLIKSESQPTLWNLWISCSLNECELVCWSILRKVSSNLVFKRRQNRYVFFRVPSRTRIETWADNWISSSQSNEWVLFLIRLKHSDPLQSRNEMPDNLIYTASTSFSLSVQLESKKLQKASWIPLRTSPKVVIRDFSDTVCRVCRETEFTIKKVVYV